MRFRRPFFFSVCVLLLGGAAFWASRPVSRTRVLASVADSPVKQIVETRAIETSAVEPQIRRVAVQNPKLRKIVEAARAQVGDEYDASYRTMSYPGGDVPKGRGACTDVIVRAFRAGGMDLQKLIHDDMKAHFRVYPNSWKMSRTDKNIDHRRVPNHIVFFKRFGKELPIGTTGAALKTWQPGDIVEWKFDNGLWHTGIVSDGIGPRGLPLVVHNAWQCVEQDALDEWEIKAHFRFPKNSE